jgi:WD40 repeat protein
LSLHSTLHLLQRYVGHTNTDYRIRSCFGLSEAIVLSGSENGQLFVWDLLEGTVIEQLDAHRGKVASAVAWNGARKEWASAGADGEQSFFPRLLVDQLGTLPLSASAGFVQWIPAK